MAKKSSIEKNNRRKRMVDQYAAKRAALKAQALDEKLSLESASRRVSSWQSFRATPHPIGSGTVARYRGVRAVSIAN